MPHFLKSAKLQVYTGYGTAHIRELSFRACVYGCLPIPKKAYGGQLTFFFLIIINCLNAQLQ